MSVTLTVFPNYPLAMAQTRSGGLARRLLFPALAHDDPLPSLFSAGTDDIADELDAELYDILALSLRAFVLPWWSKISKFDRDFTPRITQIIVHVVRGVYARLVHHDADTLALFLQDVPTILTTHYADYRLADSRSQSTQSDTPASSRARVFHALQPHVAISQDGVVDPTYLRLIIEHAMQQCLPPEDWEADTERFVVREVLVHLLVENLFERMAQPWFWMKAVLDVQQAPQPAKRARIVCPQVNTETFLTCHPAEHRGD
jgi:hypothetical protein